LRHRKTQLRARPARQDAPPQEAFRLRDAASRKAACAPRLRLLALLERRLDSVIYRVGFASSRAQARQVVRHGHIQVNGHKVDIPSYTVKAGDVVELRESSRSHSGILAALEASSHGVMPSWIEFDREQFRGKITGNPRREELVQIPINEQLIVELYSR
jgi:small subunit ribosomal protein S4